jgi:hypothetical protein
LTYIDISIILITRADTLSDNIVSLLRNRSFPLPDKVEESNGREEKERTFFIDSLKEIDYQNAHTASLITNNTSHLADVATCWLKTTNVMSKMKIQCNTCARQARKAGQLANNNYH